MVSGIYSLELIKVDSDIFFVSFYDIDEAPTGCYFIKGSLEDALGEYLKYTEHLGMPFLELFKALRLNLSSESGLMQGWMAANTFTKNEGLEGLQIRLATTGLNPNLWDLIDNAELQDSDNLSLFKEIIDGILGFSKEKIGKPS